MNKLFGHLKTVLTHKYYVCYYGRKMGLSLPARLAHDLSKFHPIEFFESVKYYTGVSSPIDGCKANKGYSMAWFHHRGNNRHHYEYWADYFDDGGKPGLMPYRYALEMVCDYLAAGRAYTGKNFTIEDEIKWWEKKNAKPLLMHPAQREFVTRIFNYIKEHNYYPSKKVSKLIYEETVDNWRKTL